MQTHVDYTSVHIATTSRLKTTLCTSVHTVPVRCDHQVKCVPGVLSMGNDSPHMYGVRTIENKMKPWEILEKMQF